MNACPITQARLMNRIIVVADAGRIRLFAVRREESRRTYMLETLVDSGNPRFDGGPAPEGASRTRTNTNRQAGPVHLIEARRDRHALELDRRFVSGAVESLHRATEGWREGSVLLVAAPHLLGLMREALQGRLSPALQFSELARDYAQLTPAEILDRLVLARAIT